MNDLLKEIIRLFNKKFKEYNDVNEKFHHDNGVEEKLIILTNEIKEVQDTLIFIKEKTVTIKGKQDNIILKLKEIKKMASQGFELMEAKIAELKTVDDSVLALITELNDRIQNATTLEEAQQIAAEVDAEKVRLAAAVPANTPAENV